VRVLGRDSIGDGCETSERMGAAWRCGLYTLEGRCCGGRWLALSELFSLVSWIVKVVYGVS
jgi:hypothetical protein